MRDDIRWFALINQRNRLVDNERDWLIGIRVENTVRMTCVLTRFQCEFDKYMYKNAGGSV